METETIYRKLGKLCPGDKYPAQQRILDDARIPGTCQWFLGHEKTQNWLNGDGDRVLWLHGPSASGKTFLSSSLVNHIHQNCSKEEGMAVGVFYFGRNDLQYNLADYDLAFRSIIRQLMSQTTDLWQRIMDDTEIESPGLSETSDMMVKMARTFDRMVVVLDGVDATNKSGLEELMHRLFENKNIPSLRILITSRLPTPDALKFIGVGISEIEARAPESDIALYFAKYIDESPVSPEILNETYTKPFPYQKFFDVSNGLFLPLVPRWFSNVASQPNTMFLNLVESWWSEPQGDVPKAFCKALMKDILSSESADVIICVLYQLVLSDGMGCLFTLPMAYEAFEVWDIKNPDGSRLTIAEIERSCESLVFLDRKTQAMILRSPLLMEHLRASVFGDDHQQRQTTASMRYLSEQEFKNGACKSSVQLANRFRAHPYLWFAARNASHNLSNEITTPFESNFLALTASQGSIDSYQQAAEAWPYLDDETYEECERTCERWNCYTRGSTALHLATSLGVGDAMIQKLISRGAYLEACDGDGRTALHVAAGIEDESSTLKSLLLAGSSVAATDRDGLTPLAIAIVHANLTTVKLLIEHGGDMSAVDEEDLQDCVREKPEIAQFLGEFGIDMPNADEDEDEDEDGED